MVEKEGKVIDVMKNIILLKNVWLKMSRRIKNENFNMYQTEAYFLICLKYIIFRENCSHGTKHFTFLQILPKHFICVT